MPNNLGSPTISPQSPDFPRNTAGNQPFLHARWGCRRKGELRMRREPKKKKRGGNRHHRRVRPQKRNKRPATVTVVQALLLAVRIGLWLLEDHHL